MTKLLSVYLLRGCAATFSVAGLLAAEPAIAEALTPETTRQAEQLGEQGVAAYEAAQYHAAREHLEKGYELSGWGTIGVWLAKTYERLGMRTEAFRVYSDVASTSPAPGEATPFANARQEARQAVVRLSNELALIQLKRTGSLSEVTLLVNGSPALLDSQGRVVLPEGEHTLEVSWPGGSLGTINITALPGRTRVIELDAEPASAAKGPSAQSRPQSSTEPEAHNLKLLQHGTQGWTLNDSNGNVVCTLPCRWSGTEPESLHLRQGDTVLPMRINKRERQRDLEVRVRPERGSKGWALGLGITSGVLTLGSLQAASEAGSYDSAGYLASAAFFGAGFAACTWWFLWSKSRPYLDYEAVSEEEFAKEFAGAIDLHWAGSGLLLSGSF